MGYVFWRAL